MNPNYEYLSNDIEYILRKADLHKSAKQDKYHADYAIVSEKELDKNFFALDLLSYISKVKDQAKDRRFAVAYHVSGSHWVTITLDCKSINITKLNELCGLLEEKNTLNRMANSQMGNVSEEISVQDSDVIELLKEVYEDVEVQFVDSTESTYLSSKRKSSLKESLNQAFKNFNLTQVQSEIQQQDTTSCGVVACLNIESFLKTGQMAGLPENKIPSDYIKEVRQEHYDAGDVTFKKRQGMKSTVSKQAINTADLKDFIKNEDFKIANDEIAKVLEHKNLTADKFEQLFDKAAEAFQQAQKQPQNKSKFFAEYKQMEKELLEDSKSCHQQAQKPTTFVPKNLVK